MSDNPERSTGTGRRGRAAAWRRSGGLAALAAAAAAALAGCGGRTSPSVAALATTTSSTPASRTNAVGGTVGSGSGNVPGRAQVQQDALKYAECMRQHGVPSFPDPSPGGGFLFRAGSGVDRSSPGFRAAQAACQKYMGGGLAAGAQTHPAARWLAKMVRVAHCMRQHGVPSFPDPTTTIPSLTVLGGGGQISDIDGAVFVFPSATIDRQSPAFTRAATTCGFPLHNH